MATLQALPLELLVSIVAFVHPSQAAQSSFFKHFMQTARTVREAAFMLSDGQTLKGFNNHDSLCLALKSDVRRRHLKIFSLDQLLTLSIPIVLPSINISRLRILRLNNYGMNSKVLDAVATAFANAAKPLALTHFTLRTMALDAPQIQAIFDALVDSPLCSLTIHADEHIRPMAYVAFNTIHPKLVSLSIPGTLVVTNLDTALPNLRTFQFDNGAARPQHPYPLNAMLFSRLHELYSFGDGLLEALPQLPPATFPILNRLELNVHLACLNDLLPRLPQLPSLETCKLLSRRTSAWEESKNDVDTFPTLTTIAKFVGTSPALVSLEAVISGYDPTAALKILTSCVKLRGMMLFAATGEQDNMLTREMLGTRFVIVAAWRNW
ncbi:hypothetical protein HDV00_004716 [Rhizophlyctis rosea]|nr:hypothetical protein HDV00_004716 [Rhizophlyctis rosea]